MLYRKACITQLVKRVDTLDSFFYEGVVEWRPRIARVGEDLRRRIARSMKHEPNPRLPMTVVHVMHHLGGLVRALRVRRKSQTNGAVDQLRCTVSTLR